MGVHRHSGAIMLSKSLLQKFSNEIADIARVAKRNELLTIREESGAGAYSARTRWASRHQPAA